MTFVQEHPVITLWVLWLIAVPLGPLTGLLVRRRWNSIPFRGRLILFSVALLSIGLALLMLLTRWSLRGFWADAVNLAFAYIAAWVLCSIPYVQMKWFGENGRLVAGYPSVLLALCVYTNLPFVVVVDGMAPNSILKVRPGLVASIHQFGWVTMNTDIVELVKRPSWFPVIEHTVYKWVNSDQTCGMGRIKVYAESKGDAVVSTCSDNPSLTRTTVIQ